ncbi:MAG: recombinase family protein, partial [Rhodopila sp.]
AQAAAPICSLPFDQLSVPQHDVDLMRIRQFVLSWTANLSFYRVEQLPDQRVQEALMLVFAKFAEFHSIRQVHIWLREEGIVLPVKSHNTEGRAIIWKLPAYNTVHNILTNPIYAGAYAFGRTTSKVSVEDGRKRVRRGLRRPVTEWDVLLKEQHEGYITWDEFEKNQRVIANNANRPSNTAAATKCHVMIKGFPQC